MNLNGEDFDQLRKMLWEWSGLSLSADKHYLVQSRLEPIVLSNQFGSFTDLVSRLRGGDLPLLRDEVVEAMVTNETSFNRDGHPFEELRRVLFPQWIETLNDRKDRLQQSNPKIKIWSAAASTGQEPYSIAMAILDSLQSRPTNWTAKDFTIHASDISLRALRVARSGTYSEFEMERGLSDSQRTKYFSRKEGDWKIDSKVQAMIHFHRTNLLQSHANPVGFDTIFCRNILFYFDEPTRSKVCMRLAKSLVPGGILILGSAEHLPAADEKVFVRTELGTTVIYRRLDTSSTNRSGIA